MLNEEDYLGLCEALEGRNLQALWWSTEDFSDDFSSRHLLFLRLLGRLMEEGRIRLAKHGKFLESTVDEQLELFRQVFPKTEAEMEDGIWFFDEICPGGAVWVLEDGSFEWT
ncbi:MULTISPECIES: DUF596 domain-containing protein [Photorhabdus]|uniref:DUF596 domain-containing protein n=2 Tax=Photorhabdus asymbiotica TaxID=291112 RepID=B6VN16_PHOAA|nr:MULTISPECIES: DUF596 domain-containing protein [Photorhabdus]MCW7549017.1 DUF596 domain-containing protein [Photorhabdus aballayi]RKS54119.1 hypothetical protein BDD30_4483 [Photorhabdus asymbiotica]CAQ85112.1 conserved hypothetical protein [Photorhabdus asymbiotica]CAR67546.1 Hypothetical Protein PA-RVA15-17-0977 [Photorhabdus asymbiotica subsp. asymbiotica ATCC 43949]